MTFEQKKDDDDYDDDEAQSPDTMRNAPSFDNLA